MEADAFKTNLETVKELILDEQKLVTYISLSRELCIHVNVAKSLLSRIIQDIRRAQPEIDLCVSYLISGLLNNNFGCTTVCPETDIVSLKKSLKIVFYEHVYGVSRGLKSVDKVALSAINKFEDLPLCTGLITANSCTKRTNSEIGNLKSNKNHAIVIAPKSTSGLQNMKDKVKEITIKDHGDKKRNTEVKLEPSVKSEVPSPKVLSKNKTPTKINGNKIATKSIAGFFSKVNSDSSKTKKCNLNHESKVKEEKVQQESINSMISPKAMKNAPIKYEEDKPSCNNLKQIKKSAKVDSKRKRLLHVSDSESEAEENNQFTDEMNVDHESEDEIPPTPTINTVKITSGIVNPKKRRKIVDKTYTDEDGYILTKKEEVYESCSDEEAKENVKLEKDNVKQETDSVHANENTKQTKDNSEQIKKIKTQTSPNENKTKKKKVSPPQKGKQSTINNFFKKV